MSDREILHINYDGHILSFKEQQCFESRGKSTIAMVQEAFDSLDSHLKASLKPFSASFYLGDKNPNPFSYCSQAYDDRTIPCHAFHQWKEIGIEDYDSVCDEMQKKGAFPPKDERLFWIGNAATHPTRLIFIEIAKARDDILAIDSGFWHGPIGSRKQTTNQYISLPDHCNYKYLMDIQGNGYSGRAKLLFHSNRPVFYQDRPRNEYWFFQMVPYTHYIPVKEDFSDLQEKLDWAKTHPKECNAIAANALQFAKTNLRRANAIQRYQEILLMLGDLKERTIT